MADDPAMLRLLAATEAAGSKLVMIGDHRQIGAVGGGSLEALISRHRGGVHVLTENVRQVDPDERAILAELRAGEVDHAVNWYAQQQRVKTTPSREEVLEQMVADWTKDVAEGRQSAMLAWRRANVAALNARARATMALAGRLSGPEMHVGTNIYQAGDAVVMLAPSAHGQLVTSQGGRVIAVDLDAGNLTVSMDDGSTHALGPEETAPDRLAHGYATTMHRSQGATFDTAHLFADGGGRELGYVGVSRAKVYTHVHVVADDMGQAVDYLSWDWRRERRQQWAIDTGTPDGRVARHPLEVEADKRVPAALRTVLGHARLKAEREAIASLASHGQDADRRGQVAQLDSYISILGRKIESRKNSVPRTPNQVGVSVHRESRGPEI